MLLLADCFKVHYNPDKSRSGLVLVCSFSIPFCSYFLKCMQKAFLYPNHYIASLLFYNGATPINEKIPTQLRARIFCRGFFQAFTPFKVFLLLYILARTLTTLQYYE